MAATIISRRVGRVVQKFALISRVEGFVVWKNGGSMSVMCGPCRSQTRLRGLSSTASLAATDDKSAQVTKILSEVEPEVIKERFIPVTRRTLVRLLMQEKQSLNDEELRRFESFAQSLDAAVVHRCHANLQELKSLFDPINPDKDTLVTRKPTKRERLDSEFWLLQKLEHVMEKANFHALPQSLIQPSLDEHPASEGVLVSVDTTKYDVLRFWALGQETPPIPVTRWQHIANLILRRSPPKPISYYKRVVLAVRLKKDDKLLLKAFKEVPVNALEQLLPDGQIKMRSVDRSVIATCGFIAGTGLLAKIVTVLAGLNVDWTLVLTGVTGLLAIQAWTTYKNRHLAYMNDAQRMLYFKNIANNRGLLTLLVDRAEDELFKEALLVYIFLLSNRMPSLREGTTDPDSNLPATMGGLSPVMLERQIEEWVKQKTGTSIEFESESACHLLEELGILSRDYEHNLFVLPLDSAKRNLPPHPPSMAERADEPDIVEGWDRDVYDETEVEYKAEEKKRRLFGWF